MTQSDTPLYDIIFRGDIMPGHQLPNVKAKLAQLFKADEQKINALFTGAAVPLKKNLEKISAEKYQAVLRQAGADVQISPAGKVKAKAVRSPAIQRKARQDSASRKPESAEVPMTMQERLAQQQTLEKAETAVSSAKADKEEASVFTLAPVGADLLESSEKTVEPVVNIDVSQFDLKPQEGNLVESTELQHEDAVVVDLQDYGLSELGDDLLQDDEREVVVAPVVSALDVDLAPTGSELGQIKKAPPPPAPDTSSITLE